MTFEHRCTVPVARETLWNFLMDVQQMASCVPGTSEVAAKEGGEAEAFTGRMRVTVGPIGLTLQGVMTIQERRSRRPSRLSPSKLVARETSRAESIPSNV